MPAQRHAPRRDATITPATWDRACRALGPPLRILVHDLLAARIERELDDDQLDIVPFPTPRARS